MLFVLRWTSPRNHDKEAEAPERRQRAPHQAHDIACSPVQVTVLRPVCTFLAGALFGTWPQHRGGDLAGLEIRNHIEHRLALLPAWRKWLSTASQSVRSSELE